MLLFSLLPLTYLYQILCVVKTTDIDMSSTEDILASSDSFWEVDCYRRTVKRTEDGLHMCRELSKIIFERSEIEREYAKKLQGWSKKWSDSIEKG